MSDDTDTAGGCRLEDQTPKTEYAALLPYGVKMILKQGFLDHWFTRDAWGDIKPADGAFSYAITQGLIERKGGRHIRFRLTDKGRDCREVLNDIGGCPAGDNLPKEPNHER